MIYRFMVITNGENYELWANGFSQAEEKFAKEFPDIEHEIFHTGALPVECSLNMWRLAKDHWKDETLAKKMIWTFINVMERQNEED